MLYDGESSTLKFACLTVADAGKYTCVAENQLGETKTSVRFSIISTMNSSRLGQHF